MTNYTIPAEFSKEDRVSKWELGLPTSDELVPLSQPLIPSQLASAFGITPESYLTHLDVTHASEKTISNICGQSKNKYLKSFNDLDGADGQKSEQINDQQVKKKDRLVWTPQLHKRFVDVVTYIGIENTVARKVLEVMDVEGLTRQNVSSHLQKYRLYLERKHR